jgi:SAM-dependent methyltransferase
VAGNEEFTYFDAQASWGVTKHMGGLKATRRLAELCHLNKDTRLLEVGCGVGLTSCYLAQRYGCHIVGVDLSPKMVEWATKRAQRKGLLGQVEYRTADAQDLPFADGSFDVVMCESVTAFPADKQKAVSEYTRVTRSGGYVGMNEGTWIQPPPAELVAYCERTMAHARFLSVDEWKALLVGAGLLDVIAQPQQMNAFTQRLDEMAGLDWQDWKDRLRGIGSFIGLYLRNPGFRRYAKEITPSMGMIRNVFTYLGYGFYAGRKGSPTGTMYTGAAPI